MRESSTARRGIILVVARLFKMHPRSRWPCTNGTEEDAEQRSHGIERNAPEVLKLSYRITPAVGAKIL
jgi:hypothetical protein